MQGSSSIFIVIRLGLLLNPRLDGSVHQGDEQKENDAKRDKALDKMGLRIVRFWNEEIMKDMPCVLGRIRDLISNNTV